MCLVDSSMSGYELSFPGIRRGGLSIRELYLLEGPGTNFYV